MRSSANIEVGALILLAYIVAHGKQNAYHMKMFYFYSEAWVR